MKFFLAFIWFAVASFHAFAQNDSDSAQQRQSLDAATAAIRDAFARGDAALATKLHSPEIVKYFGGNNVVAGRAALEKGLTEWFRTTRVEFVENRVESTIIHNGVAIQSVVFSIKATPKDGGKPVTNRGRSVVVYVQDATSPTGWFSLREIAQEGPSN